MQALISTCLCRVLFYWELVMDPSYFLMEVASHGSTGSSWCVSYVVSNNFAYSLAPFVIGSLAAPGRPLGFN